MFSKLILTILPLLPKSIVYTFAKKYIAGPSLKDAIKVTKDFQSLGGKTTIDVLGEFVQDKNQTLKEKSLSLSVLDAIRENDLPTYLSIKPTSLGLGIDFDLAYENVYEVVSKAASQGSFVRLDMENSPYTQLTLDLYTKLREQGFTNVGIVIQAYLKRSLKDIETLQEYKPNIRLCKGIYVESADIAFKDKEAIRNNYKLLFDKIVSNNSYIGIATHDEDLIRYAEKEILNLKLQNNQYEFQMLLGVRQERRDDLLRLGHNVRIYVPFGKDWYGYSVRRLQENPQMAIHITKAIFTRGK